MYKKTGKKIILSSSPMNSGSQTRTDDNLINSQVLYQLSYAGITHQHKILYHVDKSLQTIILNFIYQNY